MRAYDAFISYSHRSDGDLAPALEVGLQRLAKPWNERRAMDVFLDRSDLSASPHLWSSIVVALDAAEWFVLLASPEAASSKWVGDEITHWLSDPARRERFLLVLTHGTIQWSGDGFTPDSDAVHPALQHAFTEEPNYVDMRLVDRSIPLDLRNPSFKDAVANLSATIRGTTVGDLIGEDTRQFRIARRLRRAAVGALAVLTIGAVIASVVAVQQRSAAETQRNEAEVQRNEAVAQREAAELAQAEAESNAAQARARELAALALDAQTSDPALATLLAVEASFPNGATEPIDVPEARSALGVTLRSSQGATVRRVGPRITSRVTDILAVEPEYIATYDAAKGTRDLDFNPLPPDFWDPVTGDRIESPLDAAAEARLLLPFGEKQSFSDVIGFTEVGVYPVLPPLFVDDSTDRLYGVEPATGDAIVQQIDDGEVLARLPVPGASELVQLELLRSGDLLGLTLDGTVVIWPGARGAPIELSKDAPVRSLGALDGDRVVIEEGEQFVEPGAAPGPRLDDPLLLELTAIDALGRQISLGLLNDGEPTVPGTFEASPSGDYVAAVGLGEGFNQPVIVWDLLTARRVAEFDLASPTDLAWITDDTLSIASSRGYESYRLQRRGLELPLPTSDLTMSADGTLVTVSSSLDLPPPVIAAPIAAATFDEQDRSDIVSDRSWPGSVSLTPEGDRVAYSTSNGVVVTEVATGVRLATFPAASAPSFSPDGTMLAIGGDAQVQMVDTADWRVVRELPIDEFLIGQVVWSPDATRLLVRVDPANSSSRPILVDVDTGTATTIPRDQIGAMAWRGDGEAVALGGEGGVVELWRVDDLATSGAKPTATFVAGGSVVTGLSFSPDGTRLVASSLTATTVWDVQSVRVPRRLQVVTDLPMWQFRRFINNVGVIGDFTQAEGAWGNVAFRPDGRSFVIAGPSGMAELPDYDPALACAQASDADLAAVEQVLGAPSACTRVPGLLPG